MIARISTVAVAATMLVAATTVSAATSCSSGLHMIVARASTEKPGTGIIGKVANETQARISGSSIVPVVYPATLTNYTMSETSGVNAMRPLIEQYVDACPGRPIALLGYSQGAQVVGDIVCGNSETGAEWKSDISSPLTGKYADAIVAVVQMGDPTFVPGLSWDVGTSKKHGVFIRGKPQACDPFSSRIQSYCDFNDLYCASGKSLVVHISYVVHYGDDAVDFISKKYKAMPTITGTATQTGVSASASATASTGSSTGNFAIKNGPTGIVVALALAVAAWGA